MGERNWEVLNLLSFPVRTSEIAKPGFSFLLMSAALVVAAGSRSEFPAGGPRRTRCSFQLVSLVPSAFPDLSPSDVPLDHSLDVDPSFLFFGLLQPECCINGGS